MVGCCATGCSNRSEKGFVMKAFPTDPQQREIWAARVKREEWIPTTGSRLCEIHFAPEMWERTREDGKRILKRFAIPTIFNFSVTEIKSQPADDEENPIGILPEKIETLEPNPWITTVKTENIEEEEELSSSENIPSSIQEHQFSENIEDLSSTKNLPPPIQENQIPSVSKPKRKSPIFILPAPKKIPTVESQCTTTLKTENNESSSKQLLPPHQIHQPSSLIGCSASTTVPVRSVLPIEEKQRFIQKLRRYETLYKKLLHKTNKYKNKIRCLNRKIKKSKTEKIRKIFNEDQILALQRKSTKFLAWSNNTMTKSLRLKFSCGNNGYLELLRQKFPYPSLRSISRYLHRIKFDCGTLEELFSFLKIKVESFTGDQKDCCIILHEIDITPEQEGTVTKALVITIRGITVQWKQILAYYFIGNSINATIFQTNLFEIIKKTEQIGLNILSIVSDMNATYKALWELWHITQNSKQNFIVHPCNTEQKIYIFVDVPNLFKNIKKVLMTNKLEISENIQLKNNLPTTIISNDHIQELFDCQKSYSFRIVPKSTEEDLTPNHLQRIKLSKYAVAYNVSNGLKFLSEKLNKPEYKTTAWFLNTVDKWFTLMTSRDPTSALSKKKYYISFLKDVIDLFFTLKVEEKMFEQFQMELLVSTESVINIQDLLLGSKNYSFVMTSRFTEDSSENIFSPFRPKNVTLNAQQFKTNLKSVAISQYLKNFSKSIYDKDE